MKFRKFGQVLLATVVSAGMMLGVTSCANNFTVGYIYVLGTQPNGGTGGQIGAYKEDNNNGNLKNISGEPFGSNGTNPVRAIIPSGGRFLYVLNAGAKTEDSSGNLTYTSGNISVFSIGGYGQLTFQSSYSSQGVGSIRLAADSSGTHLFVLDSYSPIGNTGTTGTIQTVSSTQTADFPCYESAGVYRAVGDITAFAIDESTGRLTLVPNQQQQNLTYFPVGCAPVDFHVTPSYVYTIDAGATSNSDVQTIYVYSVSPSTGQLTQTQNVPLQTNAVNIVSMNGDTSNSHLYLLDATQNLIYQYSIGSQGALSSINGGPTPNSNSAAGNPQQLVSVTGSPSNYVYVVNSGTGNQTNIGQSDISGYVVNSATGHLDNPSLYSPYGDGIPAGGVCIFLDPSSQYIFVAGSADNTISGRKYDPGTGSLKPLNKATAFTTVGTPSWCLSTSASH